MLRALAIAFSGVVYFVLSLLIFLPFRMKPVENYNLFALPSLAVIFFGLVYKACTAQKESRGYLFAFYAGILMWQVIGEIPFIEVPAVRRATGGPFAAAVFERAAACSWPSG